MALDEEQNSPSAGSLKVVVLNLWERDYNSKFLPSQLLVCLSHQLRNVLLLIASYKLIKTFFFDATAPIDRYHDYCSNRLTSFLEYPDVVLCWDTCGTYDDPVSLMAWDMIAIPVMSSECERIFSSAGRLITPVRNCLRRILLRLASI